MGRFCILCARKRPNEAFGGKGERSRICRWCRRLPRTQRNALKSEHEILDFLEQSHVSDKNLARLRALKASPDSRISSLAAVVLDVAVATPYRRRRFRILARQRRDLLTRMEESGLICGNAGPSDFPRGLIRGSSRTMAYRRLSRPTLSSGPARSMSRERGREVHHGGCLCGAVRYEVAGPLRGVSHDDEVPPAVNRQE